VQRSKKVAPWRLLSKSISKIGDSLLYLPSAVTYLLLILIPFAILIVTSLTNYNWTYPDTQFVGFKNYISLASDAEFIKSLFTTLKFAILIVIFPNVAGLIIALLLNSKGKLYRVVRVMIFLPMTLSSVVVSVVWGSILTDNGILNAVLKNLHLSGLAKSWIGSQAFALPSVAFIVSWQTVGFCMVIYLADLQSIPSDLIEAAKIDGCTERQLFRQISWPLLAGSLTINTTVLSLVGLRLYDQVIVITAGGPAGSTDTIATNMIRTAFQTARVAYASAMAILLTILVAIITSSLIYFLNKREVER
jgi:multiple sugar transport system permease protein